MSLACDCTLRSIASRARVRTTRVVSPERRASVQARIELSGVRHQCEKLVLGPIRSLCVPARLGELLRSLRFANDPVHQGEIGSEFCCNHREGTHVPLFVGAFPITDEEDAEHLVEPDQRNDETRSGVRCPRGGRDVVVHESAMDREGRGGELGPRVR